MPLNEKQSRFVEEYPIDLNATQAAIRAGYSAKTAYSQGQRLLKHVEVSQAISDALSQRSQRTEITQDRVLQELAKIGFADMRKLLRWTGNRPQMNEDVAEESGEVEISVANFIQLFDSDELDDDIAASISEISQTKDGALKVKLHDKQAALVSIGRHLGMFTDKVEHSGKVELERLSVDVLNERIARYERTARETLN